MHTITHTLKNKVGLITINNNPKIKIPHVGFNTVFFKEPKSLFFQLSSLSDFYFTHSYCMLPEDLNGNLATCEYGKAFLAAFEYKNIFATQFHPEKSQTNGLIILRNFLSIAFKC